MRREGSLKVSLSQTARRDALIREHIGLVRDAVARVGGALPAAVDAGDLAGHGIAALIEAADEYEGKAGGFGAYAKARVWRRVTGFVRGQEWYGRMASPLGPGTATSPPAPSPRGGEGETATAASPPDSLSLRERGRTATAGDMEAVCAMMAVEAREFFASPPGPLSTSAARPLVGEEGTATSPPALSPRGGEGETATAPTPLPPSLRGRGETTAARPLAERIAALPELERTVLGLWFQEELSLQEIAEVLGMELMEVKAAFASGGLRAREGHCRSEF